METLHTPTFTLWMVQNQGQPLLAEKLGTL
jgi:hypothetical protein